MGTPVRGESTPVRRKSETAGQRGHVYGFLRRVFSKEADAPLLDWCRQQQTEGLWAGLGVDFAVTLGRSDVRVVLDDLAVDYCRLFITSGRAGSPHESVHAGAKGPEGKAILMSEPVSEVKDLYREAGFELDPEGNQMPDALGVELEFMERTCAGEVAALRKGDAKAVDRTRAFQRRMLDGHLGRWVPAYAKGLAGFASTDFYRAMLGLLADFVEQESSGSLPGGRQAHASLAAPRGHRTARA